MDTDTLVDSLIRDGRVLTDRLTEAGVVLVAVCWAKPMEEQRWSLNLCTPLADGDGRHDAYGRVLRVLRSLGDMDLTSSQLVLRGERDPFTVDLLVHLHLHRGSGPLRARGLMLGLRTMEEVYVYLPRAQSPDRSRFDDGQKRILEELYDRTPLPVDDLPYTDEMSRIHLGFVQSTGAAVTIRDTFKALQDLSRQGRLAQKTPS